MRLQSTRSCDCPGPEGHPAAPGSRVKVTGSRAMSSKGRVKGAVEMGRAKLELSLVAFGWLGLGWTDQDCYSVPVLVFSRSLVTRQRLGPRTLIATICVLWANVRGSTGGRSEKTYAWSGNDRNWNPINFNAVLMNIRQSFSVNDRRHDWRWMIGFEADSIPLHCIYCRSWLDVII